MSKKMSIGGRSKQSLTSPSPAAEIIASNVDLLTEILLRVPARPLIKFKCVSKQWLSLISDTQFGSNHTRRNPNPLVSGIYLHNPWQGRDSLPNRVSPVSIVGRPRSSLPTFSFLDVALSGDYATESHSSNGLILCYNGVGNFVVCNLTIQKTVALPKHTLISSNGEQPYLIFDPTKSPYYKVVCVDYCHLLNALKLAIYTSECASWKYVTLVPSIETYGRGAIWNRGIIWMSCSRHEHVYSQLDLDTEKLTVTRVPPDPNLAKCMIYFGECGGRLLLIQLPKNDAMEFIVLEMDRDDFRWIVRYRVDLTSLILPNRSRCVISVISVVKGAEENDLVVVFYNRGKVFSYNLECKRMELLCQLSPGEISSFGREKELHKRSYQFIESLSPV